MGEFLVVPWITCFSGSVKLTTALAGFERCDVVYVDGKPLANQLVPGDCHYDDHDERDDRWYPKACSEYVETNRGHTYHVFHDADRPARDHAGKSNATKDFPRLDGAREPPSCATQDYLARVVSRITIAGALFLGTVAVGPVVAGVLDPNLSGVALGGTGLLIVVSVVVETMKQIEAQLMMRNYEGFIR